MDATVTRIPAPSREHSTCAWCERSFTDIVELLTHVDHDHLPAAA